MARKGISDFCWRRLPGVLMRTQRAALRFLLLALLLTLCSSTVRAQLQQPFVFSTDLTNPSSIDVYTRNDITGALTPVTGSPFPSKEPVSVMALDFKGRFLFTASTSLSKISMFTVNPDTGALQEVPNSPFASASTDQPVFLSTESSGQFLYVIDSVGSQPEASAVETFQIDPVNLDLIPSSAGATSLPGLFLNGATHPSGKSFYAFLTVPNGTVPDEVVFLVFNSSTGAFTTESFSQLSSPPSSVGALGCCLAMASQGESLALGMSTDLLVYSLNSDGTLAPSPAGGNSIFNGSANSMSFDTLGQFLYVDLSSPTPGSADRVHIFPLATLQESADSPLPSGFPFPFTWNVDPTGPLIYADQVYQVDPQTGVPGSILAANPLGLAGSGFPHAVFSQPPGSQPITGPIALLSTTSISFGTLSLGQTSSAQTLTITSNGGQALDLNTLAITGANASDFSETDTCHAPAVLQPGQNCSVLVSFTPSASGPRSAAVTITDNAAPPTESVALSGTGQNPAPAITFVPGSLSFGTVSQGASSTMSVTVNNSGTAVLNITNVVLGGANASDFSSSSPTCNSPIAVNSACTLMITFTPQAPGLRSATVTLTDNAPDSPQTLALSGTGQNAAPAITFVPGSLSFGTVSQGASSTMSVTVNNSGTAVLNITNIMLGGANASDFSLSSPTCNSPIAVNSACTLMITFTPQASGLRSATVTVTDNAPGSPQTLALSGTGAATTMGISFSPADPAFPTITEGTSGAAQTLTVTNSGTGILHVTTVSLAGTNPADFTLTNNCKNPVPAAANCTISLVFNPIGSGQRTANLTFTDDAPNSPQTIALTATANPAFTVAPAPGGSTTATVSPGQTAQFQLQLTPGAGYGGSVALACSGAPTGATCQVPTSVAIANGTPATLTVMIPTSGGNGLLPPTTIWRPIPPAGVRLFVLLSLCLLLIRVRKNRWLLEGAFEPRRRLAWSSALAAILLCSIVYAVGCGGGSSPPPSVTPAPPPGGGVVTPAGTSMIVITPTATSLTGQPLQLTPIQLTLNVN